MVFKKNPNYIFTMLRRLGLVKIPLPLNLYEEYNVYCTMHTVSESPPYCQLFWSFWTWFSLILRNVYAIMNNMVVTECRNTNRTLFFKIKSKSSFSSSVYGFELFVSTEDIFYENFSICTLFWNVTAVYFPNLAKFVGIWSSCCGFRFFL